MMDATWIIVVVVAALALAVGYLIHKTSSDRRIGGAEREAKRIVETAERDAETRLKSSERDAETLARARGARERDEGAHRFRGRDAQARARDPVDRAADPHQGRRARPQA